jgi:hypothetical protein
MLALTAGLAAGATVATGARPAAAGAATTTTATTTYSSSGRPLAVVAQSSGNMQVFWRTSTGDLLENQQAGGSWSGPVTTPISGLASDPAAVTANGIVYVFWRDAIADGSNLWEATDTGGSWSTPTKLGMGPLGSQPTADTWSPSPGVTEIDVFWQGTGSQDLWQAYWRSSTDAWVGPLNHGLGPLASAPTATAWMQANGTGQVDVYWENTSSGLEQVHYNSGSGGGWTATANLGFATLGSPPTAAALPSGQQDVFWRGTGSEPLFQGQFVTEWVGPTDDGVGPVSSAPTAVASSASELDVFWEGSDGDLWEATDSDGTWTSVQSHGSLTAPPPVTQTTPVSQTVPAPPPATKGGAKKKMRVRIKLRWRYVKARSRLHSIHFARFPGDGTVRISCSGRGCPHSVRGTATHRKLPALMRKLERVWLRVGQQLEITIDAPGWVPERVQFTIRYGNIPDDKLL